MTGVRVATLAALGAAALGGPARAQGDGPAAARAACARLIARLGGPPGDRATIAALDTAVQCGVAERARALLPAMWAAAPADTAALQGLATATSRVGGARLLRTVLRVAQDTSRPADVRVYALLPLVSYVSPRGEVGALKAMRDTSRVGGPGTVDHPSYTASSSIDPALRDTVRARLQLLAQGERDPAVRHTARVLFQSFTMLQERWSAYARQRCASLAAAYRADPDAAARSLAFRFVSLCEATGGDLLAAEWRRAGLAPDPPADTARARQLPLLSTRLRDARVLAAVQAAAEDPARPRTVRLAALHTAATLADPTLLSARHPPERALASCPRGPSWPPYHHAVQEVGGVPLAPGAWASVARLLERRAASDRDARVRRAAAFLLGCLRPFPPPDDA